MPPSSRRTSLLLLLGAWIGLIALAGECARQSRRAGDEHDRAVSRAVLERRPPPSKPGWDLWDAGLLVFGLGALAYWPLVGVWRRRTNRRLERQGRAEAREGARQVLASAGSEAWASIPAEQLDERLRPRDPSFDAAQLKAGIERAARSIRAAQAADDLGPARRYLTDALFSRLSTQRALMARNGVRGVLTDPGVGDVGIVGAESDEHFDTVHARLVLPGAEIDVPREAGAAEIAAAVAAAPRAWRVEFWSFLRRRGATTRGGAGLAERDCPGCGAPLPATAVIRCEHCRVLVNAGTHAWVLAGTVPEAEWSGVRPAQAIRGFPALARLDPQLSRQPLEDRAAFLLLKWVEARCVGSVAPVQRFLRPEARRQLELELSGGLGVLKLGPGERVASVSARLLAVEAGRPGRPDRAWARVRWSILSGADRPRVAPASQVVLARAERAQDEAGVFPVRCGACGGDLAATDAPGCEYCGAVVGSLPREWLLQDVRDGNAPIDDDR